MKQLFHLELSIRPCLRDHCVEGKAVFPAVESLLALADEVRKHRPGALLTCQADASFSKMLVLPSETDILPVQIEIEERPKGIRASLQTLVIVQRVSVRRTMEHARVTFVQEDIPHQAAMSFQTARTLGSNCIAVSADSVYREWIPFGPSYRNLTGSVIVSREGAFAEIAGGSGEADDTLLGSPFVSDAAMQAACVWGRRYAGVTAFPTGFGRRIIYRPAKKNETGYVRVVPVEESRGFFVFDVWIFDRREMLCEVILGLKMSDIFHGRLQPPHGIGEGA